MSMHLGDVGTRFQVPLLDEDAEGNTSPLDVSTASAIKLYFEKKRGDVLVVDASLVNDGTDGLVEYVFQEGDIDVVGKWRVQAFVSFADGEWHTDLGTLKIDSNIILPTT